MHPYIRTSCIQTCLHAYIQQACLPARRHTCIHTCKHRHACMFMHTHTRMHTCTRYKQTFAPPRTHPHDTHTKAVIHTVRLSIFSRRLVALTFFVHVCCMHASLPMRARRGTSALGSSFWESSRRLRSGESRLEVNASQIGELAFCPNHAVGSRIAMGAPERTAQARADAARTEGAKGGGACGGGSKWGVAGSLFEAGENRAANSLRPRSGPSVPPCGVGTGLVAARGGFCAGGLREAATRSAKLMDEASIRPLLVGFQR